MSSRAGSTVLTFLMSIPVAAVGLMAVFGVPPLSSVIAASRSVQDRLGFDEERSTRGTDRDHGSPDDESAPDWTLTDPEDSGASLDTEHESAGRDDSGSLEFENAGERPRKPSPPIGKKLNNPDTGKRSFGADSNRGRNSKRPIEESPESFKDDSFGNNSSRPKVSMKESLKKLNSLDAKKYHLIRGAEPNTWLFVCLFTPGDDSRVIHRFEAEDTDPDVAVAKTVEQIDAWLLKRFRESDSLSQMAH